MLAFYRVAKIRVFFFLGGFCRVAFIRDPNTIIIYSQSRDISILKSDLTRKREKTYLAMSLVEQI